MNGRKKGINPGYVWLPYIVVYDAVVVIDSTFRPNKTISSRYSTVQVLQNRQKKRSIKIKKIIEKC
jgi:hypothetical protein